MQKSRRLFYWREHTVHMFMNVRVCKVMYVCSCECVCLLGTFTMFSTLLGLAEIKILSISWFDFFAKNISPTIFAFCRFCIINILFAFFMFCYVKCCKFVLVLQSSPTLCWMRCSWRRNRCFITSVISHINFSYAAPFLERFIAWYLSWISGCRTLTSKLIILWSLLMTIDFRPINGEWRSYGEKRGYLNIHTIDQFPCWSCTLQVLTPLLSTVPFYRYAARPLTRTSRYLGVMWCCAR